MHVLSNFSSPYFSNLQNLCTLDAMANMLLSIIESVDFSPFTAQFQQKMKCKLLFYFEL